MIFTIRSLNANYYFHEIGFETITRFKHSLKAHLNKKMPYYTQLYKSELASEKIDFLLNKDLKETFIREIEGSDSLTGSNTDNTRNTSLINDVSKISAIADGVSKGKFRRRLFNGC